MLGIVIVNYNQPGLTLDCLASLDSSGLTESPRIELVDNSDDDRLVEVISGWRKTFPFDHLTVLHSGRNLGFASACNLAIERLLSDQTIERILLLNNDAVLLRDGLARLLEYASNHPERDMVAARVHSRAYPNEVDSMGIAMFLSALASNRQDPSDTCLGPTGGLALFSRRLLEQVRHVHGHVFDADFFCYAEDTDLALRALLLGFKPGYLDDCVALHQGQASSGGGNSEFVLYHGIRNSIWTLMKDIPASLLLILAPVILAMHVGIIGYHCLSGESRAVFRLYRDAFAGMPRVLRQRRIVQSQRQIGVLQLWRYFTARFYQRGYTRAAFKDVWHRLTRRAGGS